MLQGCSTLSERRQWNRFVGLLHSLHTFFAPQCRGSEFGTCHARLQHTIVRDTCATLNLPAVIHATSDGVDQGSSCCRVFRYLHRDVHASATDLLHCYSRLALKRLDVKRRLCNTAVCARQFSAIQQNTVCSESADHALAAVRLSCKNVLHAAMYAVAQDCFTVSFGQGARHLYTAAC